MGIASGIFVPPSPTRAMTVAPGAHPPDACTAACRAESVWVDAFVVVTIVVVVAGAWLRRRRS